MKKNRYFPFGYHMVNGKIVIHPEESALLQELFSGYLNGASLQQLADYAEGTGIHFRENAEHWNKNIGVPAIFLQSSAKRWGQLLLL